ncbi:hypothetical protein DF3PB_30013 [uncultured Defluviicoccus sp.]|uniref:Uncharacterized protein n=1 Tax=metagenome TaxID=256318 RepID=A0A380TDL2_9ZZZZ|nr:hypothetical protein DF3PB_30013 [uncultured Defluviicoccus sp.]
MIFSRFGRGGARTGGAVGKIAGAGGGLCFSIERGRPT